MWIPKQSARLLAEWGQSCPRGQRRQSDEAEDEILNIFVDICSLFQREPEVNHRASGEEPSAEAYLFSYLRMLETGGEGLPPAFVSALRRALAHYGVHNAGPFARIGREPALDLQIAPTRRAANRAGSRRARTASAARQTSGAARGGIFPHAPRPHDLDDHGLFPAVSDLAREVRYRYFDQPLFEQARKQVYEQVEDHLAYLAADPDAGRPPRESARTGGVSAAAGEPALSPVRGRQPRHAAS